MHVSVVIAENCSEGKRRLEVISAAPTGGYSGSTSTRRQSTEQTPARHQAYREWVDATISAGEWEHIRQATQQARVIGTEKFQREIEALLGRRLVGTLRGRLHKDRLANPQTLTPFPLTETLQG